MRKFTEPGDTKKAMEELVQTYANNIEFSQSSKERLHAITIFFIEFMKIHPFGDMNGRMAYILLDILLLKNSLQPVNMSDIRTRQKNDLYKAIELAQWKSDYRQITELIDSVILKS